MIDLRPSQTGGAPVPALAVRCLRGKDGRCSPFSGRDSLRGQARPLVQASRLPSRQPVRAMDEFEQRLAAAQTGDEAAFVHLFRSIQPILVRYLATIGGPLAEDAAAETWVRVVRDLHRFRGDEAGWRSWVFTIGHARLRDAQRRAGREKVTADA